MRLDLRPARDVELRDSRFVATSTEPWLVLVGWPRSWAGRFVEITYRLSLLDEAVRPLLRFHQRDGSVVRIAPAPVLGAAIWIGRLPAGTEAIEISPTNRLGAFDFRVEAIRPRNWLALVLRGLRAAPRPARSAILTRLIGWREESDVNLAWAIGATALEDYRAWAAKRTRPFEPEGLDRARDATGRMRELPIRVQLPPSPPMPDLLHPTSAGADASTATIVIPTRDQPALLRRVVASIRARTPPGYRIIIVDNASMTRDAHATLEALAAAPDIAVLSHPGAFNFSAICNAAAAQAGTDVLVFLNDDTEVLSVSWLDRLATLVMAPDVGAVGAKLTYPDGRIQHIGVVAGLGESAGHFGAFETADTPGWGDGNLAVHPVSAVTGACLAVAREKFAAVGGFDAEHLPVEYGDIDLCLKLNTRGWQTMIDPGVHLMHAESASRGGATYRRLSVHARERAIFCERWRHVLRDDPFFHPALSLYSLRAALG